MKPSTTNNKINNLFFVLGILSIILVWFLFSVVIDNSGIIPSIPAVFEKVFDLLMEFNTYTMIIKTILKIVFALLISFVLAFVFAILSLLSSKIENFVRPLITLFKTVPVVSIAAIVLIMFFKQDVRYIGTIVVGIIVIVPIIYETILTSFQSIDKNIIDSTKLESNFNFRVIMDVYVPLALPSIVTSILQSFGLGLKVLVMSEVIINPNNSIGKVIGEYATYGEMEYVFAWTIILIIIVLLCDYVLKKFKEKTWY